MKLQSASSWLQNCPFQLSQFQSHKNHRTSSKNYVEFKPSSKLGLRSFLLPSWRNGAVLRVSNVDSSCRKFGFRVNAVKGSEPFRGKSGSVSFNGLSHQSVEESKLVSSPFIENSGSVLWVLAPVALISSLVIPQFFIVTAIEDTFKNALFAETISSLSTEIIFYIGLGMFLLVTEHVQKPYLQFSPKSWSLITGLKGYLSSAFFTMGFKVFAPIIAVYVTFPVLGLPALASVAPYLVGCLAQYLFERRLESKGSSCWPVVPIIFEVYRIYQLTRATGFIEKLMYAMRDAPINPAVSDRYMAFASMIVMFRVLGVFCLWSLLTFLMRLFPSRPVAENY